MVITPDNEISIELGVLKNSMLQLVQYQRTFANTFQTLRPKDRAQMITKIESDQKKIAQFVEKAKASDVINSGTKFSLENLRQSLMTAKVQWKKTLALLENVRPGGHMLQKEPPNSQAGDTDFAIKEYEKTLKSLGHEVTKEHLKEFKTNLDSAFHKACEMSGGKPLAIQVVAESGKIKVRMIPK
jgi:hypothetical protein